MKKKLIFWVFVFLFLLALGQQFYKLYFVFLQDNFVDFKVYWDAVRAALAGGDIYSFGGLYLNKIPFNYPPTTLLFLTFLPVFSKGIASLLLLLISLGSLLGSIWLMTKMLFKKSERLIAFLISSIFFIQFFPTKFTLTLGQINLVVLLLITLCFYSFQNKKEILSGIFLAMATLIKIFPGFLFFFFWREKRWKTLVSFCLVLLTGFVLTTLVFKPTVLLNYFSGIGRNLFFKAGELTYFDQSLNSFLLRLGFTEVWRLTLRLIFTFTSLVIFLKAKDKLLAFFGLIASVMIFLPSFVWFHHYVIFIPLLIVLFAKIFQGKSLLSKLILFLAYFLISFHFRHPEIFPARNILLASHPFFGALLLWFYSIKLSFEKK